VTQAAAHRPDEPTATTNLPQDLLLQLQTQVSSSVILRPRQVQDYQVNATLPQDPLHSLENYGTHRQHELAIRRQKSAPPPPRKAAAAAKEAVTVQGAMRMELEKRKSGSSTADETGDTEQKTSSVGLPQKQEKHRRCAILLFGLPRAFSSIVLPLMQEYVLRPNAKYHCDYFVQFHHLDYETFSRSGHGGTLHPQEIYQLQHAVQQAEQEEHKKHESLSPKRPSNIVEFVNRTQPMVWKERRDFILQTHNQRTDDHQNYLYFPWSHKTYQFPSTTDNIIKMWDGIESVWNLMEASIARRRKQDDGDAADPYYDRVAILRNDVVFTAPIDIYRTGLTAREEEEEASAAKRLDKTVVIPAFAKFPVNDRMIIGPYAAAKIWATERFSRIEAHVIKYQSYGIGMHDEHFLDKTIFPTIQKETLPYNNNSNSAGIDIVQDKTVCFLRARADYSIWLESKCGVHGDDFQAMKSIIESVLGRECGFGKFDRFTTLLCDPSSSSSSAATSSLTERAEEVSTHVTTNATTSATNIGHCNKTAVVLTIRYLDDCLATRLRHLIQTAGLVDRHGCPRDVWVLHNHSALSADSPERNHSQVLMNQIPSLQTAPQETDSMDLFDGARSGSSKSSFVKFVIRHQYSHAWHLEDDTFYTGDWNEVFDNEVHDSHMNDLVAKVGQVPIGWRWMYQSECTIQVKQVRPGTDSSGTEATTPEMKQKNCYQIIQQSTHWQIVRLSRSFATALLKDLENLAAYGHHEAIIYAYAKAHNFTFHPLDTEQIGFIKNAGYGKWSDPMTQDLQRHNPEPHKLYHPVKCVAYTDTNPKQDIATVLQNYSDISSTNETSSINEGPLFRWKSRMMAYWPLK
jgi:hypothetical protein